MTTGVDEWQIAASLDDTWRSPLSIKHKFKIQGEAHRVAEVLAHLAAIGAVERQQQSTGAARYVRAVPRGQPVVLGLYRRRQGDNR